jgi:AcrR family transcriptional regulator
MSSGTANVPAKSEGSARERLLAAADELFYQEGVHTVGIDRVIERAGVAKASLYSAFGSKEELVLAYLQGRAEERANRITERMARHDNPRSRILSVFDLLGERVTEPGFRGCAFVNASAEGPPGDSKVRRVCRGSREWLRDLFTDLSRELGAADPAQLGRQLVLIYDGAMLGASMDRDPAIARQGRSMAEALLDAQTTPARRKPASR